MDNSRRGGPADGRGPDASGLPATQRGASDGPATRRRPDLDEPIRRKQRRPLPGFTGMAQSTGRTDAGYSDFLPIAQQIVNTPPSSTRRFLAYALCGTITLAILWSIFGHLRLFAIAPGEIEARGGNQVVEPLEPGQISAIPVQNGSKVAAGATVLALDPTAARAALTIAESRIANARAEAFRRTSAAFLVRNGVTAIAAPLAWPKQVPADVGAREETVLRADLAQLAATLADLDAKLASDQAAINKLAANIDAQKTLVDSRTKRTAMHEALAEQGWDSRAVVLESQEPLRQDQVHLADYEGQLAEAKTALPVLNDEKQAAREAFIAENVAAAAKADQETTIAVEQLAKAKLALTEMTLRAPVAGTVQGLAATSIGQSVKSGETLMEIVPETMPLEVTAYVLNTDIGFIRPGQPATIKIDTFPYTRYGTISGRVIRVGADAITGRLAAAQQGNDAATVSHGALSATNATQQMKDLVFPVIVAPDRTSIWIDGRAVPLTAGMSVVVEIETARRRAINYLLYPLTRIFQRDTPQD